MSAKFSQDIRGIWLCDNLFGRTIITTKKGLALLPLWQYYLPKVTAS